MTLYDSVNDIKEMLFGEKGSGFDEMREGIRREAESERVTMPPQYMMMKITNYCNSDCIYCNHAKSRAQGEVKEEISLGRMRAIIDQAVRLGVKAISISGGEPLVRKDVEEIVRQIADSHVVPVLLTNGYFLKERAASLYESGLRYFIISLDSLDADDYIDPEMLKAMHDAAAAADAQLCICGFRMVYEEDKRKEVRQLAEDFEGDLAELLNTVLLPLYDRQLLNNQNNKLYRLDLIREHEIFYDPAMQINEDLWFSLTYLRYCREIAVLKRPFLNYTQHKDGESLVSRFHENAVETSFAVLRACDALLDGRDVTDEVINGMNNRMLFNICGYAGWQYYKTNYPEEKLLENIRQLCQREDLQKLLEQTDPLGLKNRIAHALLKKKKAEAYHRLCMLLYHSREE